MTIDEADNSSHRSLERDARTPNRRRAAAVLAVLSNPSRVDVLFQLAEPGKAVSELADELQLDESAVSHALQTFRRLGLVSSEPVKKFRYYRLARDIRVSRNAANMSLRIPCRDGAVTLEKFV